MITVFAKLVCGCCTAEMAFNSKESAEAVFAKAGLGHVDITDDAGAVHESVDTFYGFTLAADEKRGLGYLAEILSGQKKWPAD